MGDIRKGGRYILRDGVPVLVARTVSRKAPAPRRLRRAVKIAPAGMARGPMVSTRPATEAGQDGEG